MQPTREPTGYSRVSTEDQAKTGVSLHAQREALIARCLGRGIKLAPESLYADEGISGSRAGNRPGLQAALDAVCAAKGLLLVYSLSRLSRSLLDTLLIADRLDAAGADIESLTESFDRGTASGKFMFAMFALLAEYERAQTVERIETSLRHKQKTGARTGSIPRGSKVIDDGRRSKTGLPVALVADEAEQADIATIRALAASGLGSRAIARVMAEAGGERAWPESTVRDLLKRPHP